MMANFYQPTTCPRNFQQPVPVIHALVSDSDSMIIENSGTDFVCGADKFCSFLDFVCGADKWLYQLKAILFPFGIDMNYSAKLVEEIELSVLIIYWPYIERIVISIECYVLKQFVIGCHK